MFPGYSLADAIRTRIERLLRQPSSTVWLRRIHIKTDQFDDSVDFYSNLLGLSLGEMTIDPTTRRPRAHLLDATGDGILQIDEVGPDERTEDFEIAFSMPQRVWYLFRSRLETRRYNYERIGDTIFLNDTNGTPVKVTALNDTSFKTPPSA